VSWVLDHLGDIGGYAVAHALLAGIPLLVGLLLALPLGWLAARQPRIAALIVGGSGLLYTIPSLALFILMPLVLGSRILDPVNVYVAMTIYTVALLVRSVVDALGSVPSRRRSRPRRWVIGASAARWSIELPLAVPVLAAGLRVAAVSNVSIVSVASLVGYPQLGYYLTDGYQRSFPLEVGVGIVACVLLALGFDLAIRAGEWALTPWARAPPPRRCWVEVFRHRADASPGRIWARDGRSGGAREQWSGARGIPTRALEHLGYLALSLPSPRRSPSARALGRAHRPRRLGGHRRQCRPCGAQPRAALRRRDVRGAADLLQPRLRHPQRRRPRPARHPAAALRHLLPGCGRSTRRHATRHTGWGCAGREVLRRVELPCALPLLLSGCARRRCRSSRPRRSPPR
jgi:osmoprotectant transport system permease protein